MFGSNAHWRTKNIHKARHEQKQNPIKNCLFSSLFKRFEELKKRFDKIKNYETHIE